MKRLVIALTTVLICIAGTASADTCIDWGKLMTQFNIDNTPSWKKVVLVEPFRNYTAIPADDWLGHGIPMMLAEYLNNVTKDVNAISGPYTRYSPAAANPAYRIDGMYQHTEKKLRIFAKLWQGQDLIKQFQIDLAYPQNKQFFDKIGETAIGILAVVSPKYDKNKFDLISVETFSVPAYENYVRGVLAYSTFDLNQMEIARTWFDESKKADLYYGKAYLGLIDVYTFLAMYSKQNRKPFSGYMEKAAAEFGLMNKNSVRPPLPDIPRKYTIKMKDRTVPLTNRFLIGNSSFVAGLDAAGRRDYAEAARQFEISLQQVPEDAITWYHLAKMRQYAGDTGGAAEAMARARELNKCLN